MAEYKLTIRVYVDEDKDTGWPSNVAADFLDATQDADVSFDIIAAEKFKKTDG